MFRTPLRTIVIPVLVMAGALLLLASPAGADERYRVRAGDTLSGIAARTKVSAQTIAAVNGIADPDLLIAGTTLAIPSPSSSTGSGGGDSLPMMTGRYTVKRGDTLWGIARSHGIRTAPLASANGLATGAIIHPGDTLAVPSSPSSSVPASSVTGRLPTKIRADGQRLALLPVFDAAAAEFGVPADLLKSVGYMESGWQTDVVSYKGAVGVGQLMPETAVELVEQMDDPTLDPRNPTDNIRMSARYLRSLLDLNGGDSSAALADYYQGHASVQLRGPYQDTQRYVQVIQGNRPMFS